MFFWLRNFLKIANYILCFFFFFLFFFKPAEKKDTAVESLRPEEEEPKAAAPSFAPQGFVFQPPVGLRSFEPAPLSPRSASAFLSPRYLLEFILTNYLIIH